MNKVIRFDVSGQCRNGFAGRALLLLLVLLLGIPCAPLVAHAQGWGFAWELGAITATPGNPFVFRLTAIDDYSAEFGLGPSLYVTPSGRNAMYSGTVNAEFHINVQQLRFSPFFGLGVAYRRTTHDHDTAFMVPVGLSAETPIGGKLSLIGTVSINLHDAMTLDGRKDTASAGLTAGIRYTP
jgi:hypothetical protein